MKRFALILIIVSFLLGTVFAQGTDIPEPQIKKNSVYGTLGFFVIYINPLINYERVIWAPNLSLLHSVSIRAGVGWWETWVNEGMDYVVTVVAMTGKRSLHLEYGLGLVYSPVYFNELKLLPAANLGLRFQDPGRSFLLRVGAGFPELAYFSAGFSF